MDCILGLYRDCRVLRVLCEKQNLQDKCEPVKAIYGRQEFLREYCAFCIKAVYARRFKRVKYTVVNTL